MSGRPARFFCAAALLWAGSAGLLAAPAAARAAEEHDLTALSLASNSARAQSAAGATREENGLRVDNLERLQDDPSSAASRRLRELYKKSKSKDARFWIVQALGSRLREKGDAGALDALFAAASDRAPDVRGSALRAMTAFTSLPQNLLGGAVIARLDSAVVRGRMDSSLGVKRGAEELGQTLRRFRAQGPPPAVVDQASWDRQSIRRAMAWTWAVLLAVLLAGWTLLGLPVFDAESSCGRLARTGWAVLAKEKAFLAFLAVLWVFLAITLAGHGFDLIGRLSGKDQAFDPGRWLSAYLAAGFCILAPGVAACSRFSGGKGLRGFLFLRYLPRAAALSIAVFGLLGPAELLYRLLLRRAPTRAQGSRALRRVGPKAVLEAGAFRCAYLLSAAMANEGHGLVPALGRAARIAHRLPPKLGFSIFDSRFTLYFAAPVLGGLYLLFSHTLLMDWTSPGLLIVTACALWAWAVVAVVLFGVIQVLEGALCAAGYLSAAGDAAPHPLTQLIKELGGCHDSERSHRQR